MKKVRRLYSQFQPEHYELYLEPDREAAVFSGRVKITGQKTGRPSKRLTLHQKGLKIKSAEMLFYDKRKGPIKIGLSRINTHGRFDEVRLHAAELLFPGRYELTLEFSGKITEQMHGIYPCKFSRGGKPKQLIATQFESHYAREVFPCIDEPEAKATFDLSLLVPKDETVIANTPVKKQIPKGNKVLASFETTPKMSSYLLAFAYGELGFKEKKTKRGITVRAYATPNNVKFTDFALDAAADCLDFYEEYFGIRYPLPKLDMIALPDFSSGAMENWGLVTYREQALLVDPKNTSLEMKQYVAMVVAHELAHQWFGNLVTMRWWTDLWLNEGFASWIEYLAVDKLFPAWKMWTQFVANDQLAGLRSDALASTHPIEVPINHPDEIRTIFDDISYQKGASVIHMLHAYLGDDKFRQGLHAYLTKHAYANAQTSDLWEALSKSSGRPVDEFMGNWVSKPGYPLLSASFKQGKLELNQQRFLMRPEKSAANALWPIPLNPKAGLQQTLMNKRSTASSWDKQPVLLNDGHSGFYCTVYDDDAYHAFRQQIEDGKMAETDRFGLLSDAASAAKAGHLPTTEVLKMMSGYSHESSAAVWDAIAIFLGDIRRVFDSEQLLEAMKPLVRELTDIQVKRLGWQPGKTEPYFDSLLRPTILGIASWANNKQVTDEAQSRFAKMKKPEDEHPDIRPVVYNTSARIGGKKEFEKLKVFYEQTPSASEKVTLSSALTNFRQPAIYKQALEFIKSDSVRAQDIGYWVSFSYANRHAKRETWKWMKANWDWIQEKVGAELGFSRMPLYAARSFADKEFRSSFVAFFEPRLGPALVRDYQKSLETIDWQAAWRQRDAQILSRFF